MVIYGWLSGVPTSRLFAAGFVPGFLVGLMLMILSYWISKKNNFGLKRKFSLQELWQSFVDALPALVLPIIILGGIFGGIFTATEAAAVAVVYGLFICLFVYHEPKIKEIPKVFMRACKVSGTIILLIAMTASFGWIMTIEGIPLKLNEFFLTITPNSLTFLFSVIFSA